MIRPLSCKYDEDEDDEVESHQQWAKKRAVDSARGSTSAYLFPPVTSTPKTTEDTPDDLPELIAYAIDTVAPDDIYEVTAAAAVAAVAPAAAPHAVKYETTAATAAATSCRQSSLSVDLFWVCSMDNEWDWRQDVQIKKCKPLIINV